MADSTRCALCGAFLAPDSGHRTFDGAAYYCDEATDDGPLTCFELAAWATPAQLRVIAAMEDDDEP